MADTLRQLRRGATEFGIRGALAVSAALPMDVQRATVRSLVELVGLAPMLRARVLDNMRRGLGADVPADAGRQYFRNLAWNLSNTVATFHRGFLASGLPEDVRFDDTLHVLDDAVAEGRGVVLIAPHMSGHELAAAAINLRHPLVMLVRQSPKPAHMARKLKWYKALGAEIVLRPSGTTTMRNAVDYVRILQRGKTIAITPDLLADPAQGVQTSIFGRPARLHVGAFVLAMLAKAPMVRVTGRIEADRTVRVSFERAPDCVGVDRDAAISAALLDWCRWFEASLKANPAGWLFWLDKRWSRFLRGEAG